MKKIFMVIHQDNDRGYTYHRVFLNEEHAEKYKSELENTGEAKWIDIKSFIVHTEYDVMTPYQEDEYWNHVYRNTESYVRNEDDYL